MSFRQLFTARGEALRAALAQDPDFVPWNVYPRPSMVRADWINLNGSWDFGAGSAADAVWDRKILVPFPPESELSGVADFDADKTPFLFYRRTFVLDAVPAGMRLLLRCGGIDREVVCVRFNGEEVCAGCIPLLDGPLCVELRGPKEGENRLELTVLDRGGTDLPWGKQRKQRGGMWYTPVSGIWQTVWLEWVPETCITQLRCTPTLEDVTVEVFRAGPDRGAELLFEGKRWPVRDGRAVLRPEKPRLWTPEDPYLYEFTAVCGEDRVTSRFALRTVETGVVNGVPRLLLNGKPYFFNGLLDQGYWPEGLWTPPDPACFEDDLRAVKEMGFNMVRKHIKLEPELFYDACDRLGVAVFQDLINVGPYSYLRDTVLPTIRIQRVPHLFRTRSRRRSEVFYRHMEAAVRQLGSVPSVVYWTVFNEGWGQQYTTEAWARMKALDPTRPVDTASGWFRVGQSDVDSRHVYFRPFRLPKRRGGIWRLLTGAAAGKPVVLSEFGGYVWKEPEHSFNPDETYGYKTFETRESWEEGLRRLFDEQIFSAVRPGLCAAVYTQLTDVEDETNGLLTYDRRIRKLPGSLPPAGRIE